MARLQEAFRRRGLDYRPLYPTERPIQELRHSYFVRDRGFGSNWLLAGGSYITIWFPSSAGLWTAIAASGMAPRLIEDPRLGANYEQALAGLIPFHELLDSLIHGPAYTSSLQVYRFFGSGTAFIWGRLAHYLRIVDGDYGWFRPQFWALMVLSYLGRLVPPVMLFLFAFALVHNRRVPDRKQMGAPLPLYFHSIPFRVWNYVRSLPQILWTAIPRRSASRGEPPALPGTVEKAA